VISGNREELIVQGVKLCSYINSWEPRQVLNPHQGVEDHLEKIQEGRHLWNVTIGLSALENLHQAERDFTEIKRSYLEWGRQLMDLYAYLIDASDAPLPGSLVIIGQGLVPKDPEVEPPTVETLHVLIRRTETTVLQCATAQEVDEEIGEVRQRLDLYRKMHLTSTRMKMQVSAEITSLERRLSIFEGREDYKKLTMESLDRYQKFLAAALKAVSGGDTPS
jgi:hypothetical protein